MQKIRENDFVQNLWTFFRSLFVQMKIVDELSIVHTWKGSQKKAASIKNFESPSVFDRFIVKKLALR